MPQTDAPETGGEREGDKLHWLDEPAIKQPCTSTVTVKTTAGEREQIKRAAAALGLTTSAYVRSRIFSLDESNVGAWRAVYGHLLKLDEAVAKGVEPSEAIQEFRKAFRDIARSAFPDSD